MAGLPGSLGLIPMQPMSTPPRKSPSQSDTGSQHFTRLSQSDMIIVWGSFGLSSDNEIHHTIPFKSVLYPPAGLPDGLYKRVLQSKVICQYKYYFISIFFNISIVLQLLLGATITALGSSFSGTTAPIVSLAAINTIIAGLLALMHNSGLPERYKNDWNEFDEVEMCMREFLETGIVKEGVSRDEAIENCFQMYRQAKKTVAKNKPAAYATGTTAQSDSKGSGSEHIV